MVERNKGFGKKEKDIRKEASSEEIVDSKTRFFKAYAFAGLPLIQEIKKI